MLHKTDKKQDGKAELRGWLPPLSATTVASLLVGLDTLSILGVGYFCYLWVVIYPTTPSGLYDAAILFVWLSAVMLMHFAALYRFDAAVGPLQDMPAIVIAVATSFLFLLAAAFSIKITTTISRLWLGWFAIGSVMAVSLARLMFSVIVTRIIGFKHLNRNVAIVGDRKQAHYFLDRLEHEGGRPISVCGVFSEGAEGEAEGPLKARPDGIQYHGNLTDLIDAARADDWMM